jgi:hypothetical protein
MRNPDLHGKRLALITQPITPSLAESAMEFDGAFRKQIRAALLDAFPQLNQLRIVVEDCLGEPLQNVTMANDMLTVVFDLIGWAKSRGRLTELVIGASAENPGNHKLRAIAEQFRFVQGGEGEPERINGWTRWHTCGVPFAASSRSLHRFRYKALARGSSSPRT